MNDCPAITFKSTKVVQTGPDTFDLEGDFTIRGVTKTEKLTLTDNGKGSTSGSIDGTMAFDRKDYGMNRTFPPSRSPTVLKNVPLNEASQRSASSFPTVIHNSTKREAR